MTECVVAPALQRVYGQRVLHVDQGADCRIDARQRLDCEDRMKKPGAAAAELLRHLDAHDAERKELVDERLRDFGALVHLPAERPDFAIGELVHAVTKQALVFGQGRQGWLSHAAMLTPETYAGRAFEARHS